MAVQKQDRHSEGEDSRCAGDELRGEARSIGHWRRRQRTAGHHVGTAYRRNRLRGYQNPRDGHGRLCLAAMRASYLSTNVQQKSRHTLLLSGSSYITTKAPELMVVVLPTITMLAPLPFCI